MTRRTSLRFLTALLAIVWAASLGTDAAAGILDKTVSQDTYITVWRTSFGVRTGDPIFEGPVPKDQRLVVESAWYTGISTEEVWIIDGGGTRRTEDPIAAIIPDPLNPGKFTMPNLDEYLMDKVGYERVGLPDLVSDDYDLFVAIDLEGWIDGGSPVPSVGTTFDVVAGIAEGLPGVQLATTPFSFDPDVGWVASAVYSGPASQGGGKGVASPEPSTFLALGSGLVGMAGLVIRRRRA